MKTLVDHLEFYLGEILEGWSTSKEGKQLPFQIAKCRGSEFFSGAAITTLGLSNFPLISTVSNKTIYQELLVLLSQNVGEHNIPAVLQDLGSHALSSTNAYLRGQIIGPKGPILDGFPFTAFYVTVPVYAPEAFRTLTIETGKTIVFSWLVAITSTEVAFIQKHGWEKFEDLLEAKDPNLIDFMRPAVA